MNYNFSINNSELHWGGKKKKKKKKKDNIKSVSIQSIFSSA